MDAELQPYFGERRNSLPVSRARAVPAHSAPRPSRDGPQNPIFLLQSCHLPVRFFIPAPAREGPYLGSAIVVPAFYGSSCRPADAFAALLARGFLCKIIATGKDVP